MELTAFEELPAAGGVPDSWPQVIAARPVSWMETVVKRVEGLRVERFTGGLGVAQAAFGLSDGAERYAAVKRERAVPAAIPSADGSDGLAGLIHDARNMVTAIELYCELLAEPGVLAEGNEHYAGELRSVSGSSRRLLERLAGMEGEARLAERERVRERAATAGPWLIYSAAPPLAQGTQLAACAAEAASEPVSMPYNDARLGDAGLAGAGLARPNRMESFAGGPVASLAEELEANRPLLGAVAGHGVTVGLSIAGGYLPVAMAREDLRRVLVNLARNAAEVMPDGGHLQISLEETGRALRMSFTDSGPGIATEIAERIFLPGYTTHIPLGAVEDKEAEFAEDGWPIPHRGLGLAIVRSLVSGAQGKVWAANREDGHGAVFMVEFPRSLRLGGMG